MVTPTATPVAATGLQRRLVLAALLSGTFMLLLDTTIVNLALPPITADLHAGESALQWIVSGYALAYGLFLLPAGWLGDRIGHKIVLIGGLVVFTVASLLCGLASGPGELIAWRVVQGLAAGAVNPSIMAYIRLLYSNTERGRAFAAYGTVAGAATSLGPILGGLLIEWDVAGLSWRPIFLANLPVGIAAVTAVALLAPRTATTRRRFDLPGLLLVTGALFALTFPLTEGREIGWPVWTFVMLAAFPVLLAAFTWWQLHLLRHGRDPLVDVRLFARRSFAAGVGLIMTFFAGFIALMFTVSLYLQLGLGFSTLEAGLVLMPFAIGTGLGSVLGNTVIAPRLGRGVLHLGTAIACLGLAGFEAVLALWSGPPPGAALLAPFLVAGIGGGMIIGPNANIVLSDVPSEVAGVASGTLSTSQRLGTALGAALIGVVLFSSLDADSSTGGYTDATLVAVACVMGALVVTGLLAFFLPGRNRQQLLDRSDDSAFLLRGGLGRGRNRRRLPRRHPPVAGIHPLLHRRAGPSSGELPRPGPHRPGAAGGGRVPAQRATGLGGRRCRRPRAADLPAPVRPAEPGRRGRGAPVPARSGRRLHRPGGAAGLKRGAAEPGGSARGSSSER